jgi:hypothetical protein
MTGGYFSATGSRAMYVAIRGLKPAIGTATYYPANGSLSITGTSNFSAPGLMLLHRCGLPDPNITDPNMYCGISTAYVKIGPDANVTLTGGDPNGLLRIYDLGKATVDMQLVSATKNSQIKVTGTSDDANGIPNTVMLGTKGTLLFNRTDPNYRPSQGKRFNLIPTASGITMSGNFGTIITTSWIPGLLKKDANTYWPAFKGEVDANNDFVAIFQGAMAGDTGGNNYVDSADLSDLSGNWKKSSPRTWQQGNFDPNSQGTVDAADLSDLSGNWHKTGITPGAPPPPVGGSVPEPATLALLGLGGLAMIRRKRC